MAETNPEKSTSYIQASFRLSPDTHEAIKQIALQNDESQSEVMRQAVALLKHGKGLPDNLKMAVVDVNDCHGPNHYRVTQWLIPE